MTTATQQGKKWVTALVLCSVIAFSVPTAADAQVYQQSYQPRTVEELIAYLQGIIAQLQAQLAHQRGQTTNTTVYTYGPGTTHYDSSGRVLGTNTQRPHRSYSSEELNKSYRVRFSSVSTRSLGRESAEFEITINLGGAPYVDVWFEYGPNGSLGERTRKERIYDSGRETETYRVRESGLRGNGYDFGFVRAVAEIPNGDRSYSNLKGFETDKSGRSGNTDEPSATTYRAYNISSSQATIEGEVDMNDFRNGLVFFVYGEDRELVTDVPGQYDRFSRVREYGDDMQKVRVDSDLDSRDTYRLNISRLDRNTRHYYRICVEFTDDRGDDVLTCGGVRDFYTSR